MVFTLQRGLALVGLLIVGAIALVLVLRGGAGDVAADTARLREAAAGAAPLIQVIDGFRSGHRDLPRIAADLAGSVPEGVVADDVGQFIRFDTGAPPGWLYLQTVDGKGYELSRKLGPDDKLVYRDAGGSGRWFYDPGDGADEVPVDPAG